MDLSLIAAANSALSAAREIGRAAVGIRDFNEISSIVAKLNDQLLKAQDSLFSHNTQLMLLQDEILATREELRKMRETLSERGKYSLVELGKGTFVYRSRADIPPTLGHSGEPNPTEPEHYICQSCFDTKGFKSVLQRKVWMGGSVTIDCSICKESFPTGETEQVNL